MQLQTHMRLSPLCTRAKAEGNSSDLGHGLKRPPNPVASLARSKLRNERASMGFEGCSKSFLTNPPSEQIAAGKSKALATAHALQRSWLWPQPRIYAQSQAASMMSFHF